MMVLLQWPSFWMSPSRNHTPGAICLTLLGCASPRVRRKPRESRIRKAENSNGRVDFILGKLYRIGGGRWKTGLSGWLSRVGKSRGADTIEIPGGSMAALKRRVSAPVKIGNVWVGGNHPIVVQSMTNTDTA